MFQYIVWAVALLVHIPGWLLTSKLWVRRLLESTAKQRAAMRHRPADMPLIKQSDVSEAWVLTLAVCFTLWPLALLAAFPWHRALALLGDVTPPTEQARLDREQAARDKAELEQARRIIAEFDRKHSSEIGEH